MCALGGPGSLQLFLHHSSCGAPVWVLEFLGLTGAPSLLKVQKTLAGDTLLLCPFVSLVVSPSLGLSRTFLSSSGFLILQRSSQVTFPSLDRVPSLLYLWKSTARSGSLLFCVSGHQKHSCFQAGWDCPSHPPAHTVELFSLLCLCEEEAEMLLGWLFLS